MIGVPALPPHPESAVVISRSPTFVAADNSEPQSTALGEIRFLSKMTLFESRQSAQTSTLFAMRNAAFEPTSASPRAVDMTALEPSSNRALSAISAPGEHLPDRISKAAQLSLEPSGNALFVGRSAHASK